MSDKAQRFWRDSLVGAGVGLIVAALFQWFGAAVTYNEAAAPMAGLGFVVGFLYWSSQEPYRASGVRQAGESRRPKTAPGPVQDSSPE